MFSGAYDKTLCMLPLLNYENMKNLFTLFLLFITITAFSQVPLTVSYNGTDVTNQNIHLKSNETMYLPISNNSSSEMNVTVEIVVITVPHKTPVMTVCWQNCYTPSAPQSVGTLPIAAGEDSGNSFDVNYNPDGNTSPADITFHIYEEGNSADYISLTLNTETAGINDIGINNAVSIFPNPAKDKFTVMIPENQINSELKLTDILGKNVKTIPLKHSRTNIMTEELPSGIYFVSIIKNGKVLSIKKLILK